MIDDALLARLRGVDTPTICNAIEVVEGRRGFDRYTRGTVIASRPSAPAMVGYARTARLAAREPSREPPDTIRQRRLDYYRYMAAGRRPAVAVIEDVDYPRCVGAYWGEINTTVHRGLGLAGALTNGVMRDLGDIPDDFPVVAGSVGPSHAYVHLREIDVPVRVFDLGISPGELVHADRHGAVVIPEAVLPSLDAAIDRLLASERLVLDPARVDGFGIDALETAWRAFEKART